MNRVCASLLSALAMTSTACVLDARGESAQGTFTRTLTVTGPAQLEIETGSGEIEVATGESGAVKVEGHISAGWSLWDGYDAEDRVRTVRESPPIEQSGNDIHIGRWPRWNNVRISYLVTVPKDTNLRVRTGSGDVRIGDLEGPVSAQAGSGEIRVGRIAGAVRVRTGSGDVELIEGTGGVNVSTGSGEVSVRIAGAGRSELSTGSGDVEVAGAAGPLRIRTGSGAIRVAGAPLAAWDLGAGSGDVSIETTDAAAFEVDVHGSSGDIDARLVVPTGRATRRELRGTVRGGGPLVSMSTGSGEVSIR
jgi:DUF4097 and DUF4098 domain-containing protein YvlB